MDIVIRQLTKPVLTNCIDQFIDIIKGIPGEYWNESHFLTDRPGKFQLSCYASDLNGRIAGYIIASTPDQDCVHIHKFMVAEWLRGERTGARMLEFFEEKARKNNLRMVTLKVLEDNNGAIRFYERHGFEVESKSLDSVSSDVLLKMKKSI